jgi:hypothetical protein
VRERDWPLCSAAAEGEDCDAGDWDTEDWDTGDCDKSAAPSTPCCSAGSSPGGEAGGSSERAAAPGRYGTAEAVIAATANRRPDKPTASALTSRCTGLQLFGGCTSPAREGAASAPLVRDCLTNGHPATPGEAGGTAPQHRSAWAADRRSRSAKPIMTERA